MITLEEAKKISEKSTKQRLETVKDRVLIEAEEMIRASAALESKFTIVYIECEDERHICMEELKKFGYKVPEVESSIGISWE